jgi:chromosome segregation ATPase
MANLFGTSDVRLAVLEEKLDVYEELSREMLAKLEAAVDKISEANQNVARILVRHEERLDQTLQSDAAIIKLLDELKEQRKGDMIRLDSELNGIKEDIESAHSKISDLSRYRWLIVGATLVLSFVISEGNLFSTMFSTTSQDTQIERLK